MAYRCERTLDGGIRNGKLKIMDRYVNQCSFFHKWMNIPKYKDDVDFDEVLTLLIYAFVLCMNISSSDHQCTSCNALTN